VLRTPHPADVVAQLERILSNRAFADCERSQQFLRYVVEETLGGRAGRIKGVTIANEVFGFEDPEQAQNSTVVRVEAGRLRRRLDQYYAEDGKGDPVRISIRKGSYVPLFESLAAVPESQNRQAHSKPPTRPKWFGSGAVVSGSGLFLVAVAVLVWVFLTSEGDIEQLGHEISGGPSLAVLPFDDVTADGSGEQLAAGLTEDIITDLSQLPAIDVIALSSVLPFEARKSTPALIGRELRVSHVLFGSVRGSPEQWRVTAQLYDTKSGNQVWAQRFDRGLSGTLALQDELALKIVEGMSVGFRGDLLNRPGRPPTENVAAHALYKQALDLVNPPNDMGRLLAARRAFERVIELDPNYAGGYAGTAYTHAFMAFWGRSESPDQDAQRAFDLSARALELDPSFGLAYSTRAFAHQARRDFDEAVLASDKAIEVRPNDPYVAIYHAAVLLSSGAPTKGIPYAERALRLDPLNPRTPYLNILGMANFHAGRYPQALDAFERNIARGGPFGAHIQIYLTATYAHLGKMDEARENRAALELYRDDFPWKDWIRRWMKEPEEAERVLGPLRELAAGQ